MTTIDDTMRYTTVQSPIGELLLLADDAGLRGLHMQDGPGPVTLEPAWRASPDDFDAVGHQLAEYFAGERAAFDVPLALEGTPFQRTVWGALQDIPYGQTISYGELARRIGRPSAIRAVGLANGRNPVSLIVPCHRVIGGDGSLTGYGGGIERKRFLLELEGARTMALPAG